MSFMRLGNNLTTTLLLIASTEKSGDSGTQPGMQELVTGCELRYLYSSSIFNSPDLYSCQLLFIVNLLLKNASLQAQIVWKMGT